MTKGTIVILAQVDKGQVVCGRPWLVLLDCGSMGVSL